MGPRTLLSGPLLVTLILVGCDHGSGGQDEPDAGWPDADAGSVPDAGQDADPVAAAWAEKVDEFWGDAPDQDTRMDMYEDLWGTFADGYACFDSYDVDWNEEDAYFRPRVEEAETFGRFYQLMREMIDTLHDPHSPLLSATVCRTPRYRRPPMFKNMNAIPIVGGCITLDDDGDLLVYRANVEADNPLDLVAGDVIVGFDGKTWTENLDDIERWKLPECDEDYAAAPISAERQRAASLPSNAHLFSTIEIRRYTSGETESYDTDLLMPNISNYMVCGDHIPVTGVDQPVETFAELDYGGCSNCSSYGIVPGTNIGFISVYGWYGGALDGFQEAVEALWDTEGLIIDQRFNLGGVVPFVDYGFPMLFDQDIDPFIHFYHRDPGDEDYLALLEEYSVSIDADEATYYDHPIAVLTGPKSGSAGDVCPYLLSHHPRARSFGRETNGAFGALLPVWVPADPYIHDFSVKMTQGQMVATDGRHMNAWEQTPDEEVWITKEDAAAGIDTVFNAALAWIEEENGP